MKRMSCKKSARLMMVVPVALGTPWVGHAATEVVVWGANNSGEADVPKGLSNVVAIATGESHSLALTVEGRVVAWGGQTNVPGGLSNVVAIAAGEFHGLALTLEGRVVAWGANDHGQTNFPNGLSNVVAIAAGECHSLALMADERVVAWGWNVYGQTNVPNGLSNVVAIAAGGSHSLALTDDGRVVAWGGENLSMNYLFKPATTPIGLSNVVAIAAGGENFLALSGLPPGLAAPALVAPRLWVATRARPFHQRIIAKNGVDTYGAAGLPPGLVLDPNNGLVTGQAAQTGTYSVRISATNSVGSNASTVTMIVNEPAARGILGGQALAGLGSGFHYAVRGYNAPEWYGASGLPPGMAIDAQTGVISGMPVEAGEFVVSLVATNHSGLATNSLTLRVSPVVAWGSDRVADLTQPTVLGGLSNVVAIAAGGDHSGANNLALTAGGRALAWGDSGPGQKDVFSTLSNVVAIAAGFGGLLGTGGKTSLSLTLTAEGRAVLWGDDGFGKAVVLSELSDVVTIAPGQALTAEGRVVVLDGWPAPNGLSNVLAIATGLDHNLALTAQGRVVAWGDDSWGQTDVPNGLSNVVAIAAGGWHSLALSADGRVIGWGNNQGAWGAWSGQATVPAGLSNVVGIAAGAWHSLALTAQGRVVAWGDNNWGQIDVPNWLSNMVAIAAGPCRSLALLQQPTVPAPGLALSLGPYGLELQAHGAPGIPCQLLRASRLPGPWPPAEPVTFTNYVQSLRPPDASAPAQFFRLLRK